MIVIDVDMNRLQEIDRKHFYLLTKQYIELYSVFNNLLYRYRHPRGSPEEDLIFSEKYLTDSVMVKNIGYINEREYQDMLLKINIELEKINQKLGDKK